jgi:hypothetical protein
MRSSKSTFMRSCGCNCICCDCNCIWNSRDCFFRDSNCIWSRWNCVSTYSLCTSNQTHKCEQIGVSYLDNPLGSVLLCFWCCTSFAEVLIVTPSTVSHLPWIPILTYSLQSCASSAVFFFLSWIIIYACCSTHCFFSQQIGNIPCLHLSPIISASEIIAEYGIFFPEYTNNNSKVHCNNATWCNSWIYHHWYKDSIHFRTYLLRNLALWLECGSLDL